jgi:hypothetical protein
MSLFNAVMEDLETLVNSKPTEQKTKDEHYGEKAQILDSDNDHDGDQEEQGGKDNTDTTKRKKKRRRLKKNKGMTKDVSGQMNDTPVYKSPYVEDEDERDEADEEEGLAEQGVFILPEVLPFQEGISTLPKGQRMAESERMTEFMLDVTRKSFYEGER